MDLKRIYGSLTVDDLKDDEMFRDNEHENKYEYERHVRRVLKQGLHKDFDDFIKNLKHHKNSFDDDYDLDIDTEDIILRNCVRKYLEKQQNWPKFTFCDILFIVIKEVVEIFPDTFYYLSWTPCDSLTDIFYELKKSHPSVNFCHKKHTVIFINHENFERFFNNGSFFYLNVAGGSDKNVKKVIGHICNRFRVTHEIPQIRHKKNESNCYSKITFKHFKWQFKYPENFFQFPPEDYQLMQEIHDKFKNITDENIADEIYTDILNDWNNDHEIVKLYNMIKTKHVKSIVKDKLYYLLATQE